MFLLIITVYNVYQVVVYVIQQICQYVKVVMMDYIYKMGIAYSVQLAVKHVLHKLYALHVSLDINLVLNHV